MLVHIQMQQMVHELAPPICVLKFKRFSLFFCFLSLSLFCFLSFFISLSLFDFIFVSLPLCQIIVRIKSINVRVKLWFNLHHLPKRCNSVGSNDKLFHTSVDGP